MKDDAEQVAAEMLAQLSRGRCVNSFWRSFRS